MGDLIALVYSARVALVRLASHAGVVWYPG